VTPQCGVAICRLALPSPSLTPSRFTPFLVAPFSFSSSVVFMRRVSISVPRSLKEGTPARGIIQVRARRIRARGRKGDAREKIEGRKAN